MRFKILGLIAVVGLLAACETAPVENAAASGAGDQSASQPASAGAFRGAGQGVSVGPSPGSQEDLVVNVGDRVHFGDEAVAEMAAVHLLSTLPNFLILEHLEDDAPQRYEVMQPQPTIIDGAIVVPDTPGLGVDIVEEAIAHYPSTGNVSDPQLDEYVYVQAKQSRAAWLKE